jgi:hypothetical protein
MGPPAIGESGELSSATFMLLIVKTTHDSSTIATCQFEELSVERRPSGELEISRIEGTRIWNATTTVDASPARARLAGTGKTPSASSAAAARWRDGGDSANHRAKNGRVKLLWRHRYPAAVRGICINCTTADVATGPAPSPSFTANVVGSICA